METGYEKAGLRGRNENGESSEFRLPIWARNFNSKMYARSSFAVPLIRNSPLSAAALAKATITEEVSTSLSS